MMSPKVPVGLSVTIKMKKMTTSPHLIFTALYNSANFPDMYISSQGDIDSAGIEDELCAWQLATRTANILETPSRSILGAVRVVFPC